MKVLIVFEEFNDYPPTTRIIIVEMTQKEYDYFSQAHNAYLDIENKFDSNLEIIKIISLAFNGCSYEKETLCTTQLEKDYFGKWAELTCSEDILNVKKLIHCGLNN